MIKIKNSNSYMSLDAWVMANVVQLWTDHFCSRFVSSEPRYRNMSVSRITGQPDNQLGFVQYDPTGRQFDQMTQAARSGVANIAEGSSRHSTSRATEMKLLDVALASLQELNICISCFSLAAHLGPRPIQMRWRLLEPTSHTPYTATTGMWLQPSIY